MIIRSNAEKNGFVNIIQHAWVHALISASSFPSPLRRKLVENQQIKSAEFTEYATDAY